MSSKKYPINKLLLASGIGYIAWFIAVIFLKDLLPAVWKGWSAIPIVNYLLGLIFGVCFSIMMIIYAYYSWKLDSKEFRKWLESQQLTSRKWGSAQFKSHFEIYGLWLMRLISLIGTFMGILISGVALFSIFKFFFD